MKNLKFKTKLGLSFLSILLFTIIISGVSWIFINIILSNENIQKQFNQLKTIMNDIRLSEKQYIITGNFKYSDELAKKLKKAEILMKELRNVLSVDNIKHITIIKELKKEYESNFKKYRIEKANMETLKSRMLKESEIMFENSENIIIENYEYKTLLSLYLNIQINEKNYILLGNNKYISNINDNISQIIFMMEMLKNHNEDNEYALNAYRIMTSAKTYLEVLNKYAKARENQNISLDIMKNSSIKLENTINEFLDLEKERMLNTVNTLRILILIIILLSISISAFLILIIINNLNKPLSEISHIAKDISESNFDVRTNYKAQDEFGFVGKTLVNTAQKLKESFHKINKYNEELEYKVKERTQVLTDAMNDLKSTQEQLVRSEKMAALGQLVAGIAHELNTPIGAVKAGAGNVREAFKDILSYLPDFLNNITENRFQLFVKLLETLRQEKKYLNSKEERRYKRKITAYINEKNIDNADIIADNFVEMGIYDDYEIIDDFLKMIKSGDKSLFYILYNISSQSNSIDNILDATDKSYKIILALKKYTHFNRVGEKVEADIISGIETVLTLYQNKIKHNVSLVKNYDDIPQIYCYPDELNQVWTNIISNSLQAMNYKGTLSIEVKEFENNIKISIADTGCGISKENLDKIFEPFFTTKPQGSGSGLGMDICKRIIDKHTGDINIKSEPGKTIITISLPKLIKNDTE